MKVGDLVRVEDIGIGVISVVYPGRDFDVLIDPTARIEFPDGTWSIETESAVEILAG